MTAVVGEPISDPASPQFILDESFPKSTVHFERYRNYIELHIEPSNPPSYLKRLADYLRDNLPQDNVSGVVSNNFSYFSYRLFERIDGWDNIPQMGRAFLKLKQIVSPFLVKFNEYSLHQAALAHNFAAYYQSLKDNGPYHINVIDELHANENAHTRILVSLLKCKIGDSYSILQSFSRLIPDFEESNIRFINPTIEFNSENIDALIEEPRQYAIIIENKIHDAVDQDRQIERYVDTAISHGISKNNIWVIYLTRDGTKVVADYSLTAYAKSILENRFIPLNYREHILPWLKDSVLPNCPPKEEWLISALQQYVDHLEGLFESRTTSLKYRNQLLERVFASRSIPQNANVVEKYEALIQEEASIDTVRQALKTSVQDVESNIMCSFRSITEEYCRLKYPGRAFNFIDNSTISHYQFYPKDWRFGPHLEWVPFTRSQLVQNKSIRIVFHIENQKDPKVKSLIDNLLEDKDYQSLIEALHFNPSGHDYLEIMLNLPKPFILLDENTRKDLLFKLYDTAFRLIPIVDRYFI